jgi:hypothetical protein
MAGAEIAPSTRQDLVSKVEKEFEKREADLRAEYEAKLAQRGAQEAQRVVQRIVGVFSDNRGDGASAEPAPPGAGEEPTDASSADIEVSTESREE